MALERLPYYKHYPADWRGDAGLRLCSLAARGLWIECLGLMHEASPRGYLLLSDDQLAVMVSRPRREVRAALAELEARGVSSRDDAGRLYSRRMVRDTTRSTTLTANGRRGGHPRLVNQEHRASLVNQDDSENDERLVNQALGTGVLRSRSRSRSKPAKNNNHPDLALALSRFETFWDAYPCKKARKDAETAFVKLNPDHELLAVLLDAVARQKLTRQWREGVYPHAATWLNRERWKDEITPEPVPMRGSFPARSEGPPPPPPADEVLAKMGLLA